MSNITDLPENLFFLLPFNENQASDDPAPAAPAATGYAPLSSEHSLSHASLPFHSSLTESELFTQSSESVLSDCSDNRDNHNSHGFYNTQSTQNTTKYNINAPPSNEACAVCDSSTFSDLSITSSNVFPFTKHNTNSSYPDFLNQHLNHAHNALVFENPPQAKSATSTPSLLPVNQVCDCGLTQNPDCEECQEAIICHTIDKSACEKSFCNYQTDAHPDSCTALLESCTQCEPCEPCNPCEPCEPCEPCISCDHPDFQLKYPSPKTIFPSKQLLAALTANRIPSTDQPFTISPSISRSSSPFSISHHLSIQSSPVPYSTSPIISDFYSSLQPKYSDSRQPLKIKQSNHQLPLSKQLKRRKCLHSEKGCCTKLDNSSIRCDFDVLKLNCGCFDYHSHHPQPSPHASHLQFFDSIHREAQKRKHSFSFSSPLSKESRSISSSTSLSASPATNQPHATPISSASSVQSPVSTSSVTAFPLTKIKRTASQVNHDECLFDQISQNQMKSISNLSKNSETSHSNTKNSNPAAFYCHWGNECDQITFSNETEFDQHLKFQHLNQLSSFHIPNPLNIDVIDDCQKQNPHAQIQPSKAKELPYSHENFDDSVRKLMCNWDSCNLEIPELDSLLEHIKKDHNSSLSQFPHSECNHGENSAHQKQGHANASHSLVHNQERSQLSSTGPGLFDSLVGQEPARLQNPRNLHISTSTSNPVSATSAPPDQLYLSTAHTDESSRNSIECQWDNCGFNTNDTNTLDSHLLKRHMNTIFMSDLLSPQPHCHGDCDYSRPENVDYSVAEMSLDRPHTHPGSNEVFSLHGGSEIHCSGPAANNDNTNNESQHHQHALANSVTMYQCEWKSCKYRSNSLDDFMSHVRKDHVVRAIVRNNQEKSYSKDCLLINDNDREFRETGSLYYGSTLNNEPRIQTPIKHEAYSPTLLHQPSQTRQCTKDNLLSPLKHSTPLDNTLLDLYHIKKECEPTPKETDLKEPMHSPRSIHSRLSCIVSNPSTVSRSKFTKKNKVPEKSICCWLIVNPDTGAYHECGHESVDPSALSAHVISTHIGSRKTQYTCFWADCDRHQRPFTQRQKIIRHLQTHTKNRPYKCDVCGDTFAEDSVLKQHSRIHSGERPFECKVCGKTFAASTALSVHARTHTGEKPLCCKWPNCNKRFSESSNLAKHMKTHVAERPYACTYPGCVKKFGRNDQLQRHLKTHLKKDSSRAKDGLDVD